MVVASSNQNLKAGQQNKQDVKVKDVRKVNIEAIKTVATTLLSSLGPKGLDKLLYTNTTDALITNDGATIMKEMKMEHPVARMMVKLAEAQDKQAGDGTTSVVVFSGALIAECAALLDKNIHHTAIVESLMRAKNSAIEHIESIANHIDISKIESFNQVAQIALSSKVISSDDSFLASMAVKAVKMVENSCPAHCEVSTSDIKLIKKKCGSIEDSKIVDGVVFDSGKEPCCKFGKVSKKENAKIALVQFQLSSPKPYTESNVVISDASQMEKVEQDEKAYIMAIINKLKEAEVDVLLIQKSILRDSMSKLASLLLNESGIMYVDNIDRTDMDFVSRKLGVKPIATADHVVPSALGFASLCKKEKFGDDSTVQITGIVKPKQAAGISAYEDGVDPVNIILCASNQMLLDEAERSMFDAISAVVCLLKDSQLVTGGGAVETSTALKLESEAKNLDATDHYVFQAYAKALKVIPETLAKNAGLNPLIALMDLEIVQKEKGPTYGISSRSGAVADMTLEEVVQPSHVTKSMIKLATEFVCTILKIDDIIVCRN